MSSNITFANFLAQTRLQKLVEAGRLDVVECCRQRCLDLAQPAFCAQEPLMRLQHVSGASLAALCEVAAAHLGELHELMEIERPEESRSDGQDARDLEALRQQPPADFLSDVGKLLANLGDWALVFRLLDCLSQVQGRVADMIDASTVLMHAKKNPLMAVRYLVLSRSRTPVEDVLKMLRIVRLLALASRFRSALATAAMIMRSTRGKLRRDAVDAVRAIQQAYLRVALPPAEPADAPQAG